MNRLFLKTIFFAFATFLVSSCTEVGPSIDFSDTQTLVDTTYMDMQLPEPQQQVVVLEEFTGVDCNNCPRGHQESQEIYLENPGRVIVIAIHNDNPLARPIEGTEDFRTEEGIEISQKLGGSGSIPVAAVNRMIFPGENQPAVTRNKWKDYVNQALANSPPVNIELSTEYDETVRKVRIRAYIHFLEDVEELNHFSLLIIENGIISPQKQSDLSVKEDYVHEHLLRGMLTPALGNLTHQQTTQGRVIIREYEFEVPGNWKVENCEVIGLVHLAGASDRVLQGAIVDLVD